MNKKRRIILILSLSIFIGCVGYLAKYFYDSRKAKNDISALRNVVESGFEKDGGEKNDAQTEENNEPEEKYAPNGMIQGYYNAYEKNNDMVGWVKIEGTDIDYPVMQNEDNEYYLHRNFEKKYQYSGLPFLDYQCDIKKPSDNLIIYAHNMKDGSMFAGLLGYEDKKFYDSHSVIDFDTNYERGKYKIFAVFETKTNSENEFKYHEWTEFESKEKFVEFMSTVKSGMLYKTGESVSYGDKILTLSTCSYNRSNERMVVMAKRIQ